MTARGCCFDFLVDSIDLIDLIGFFTAFLDSSFWVTALRREIGFFGLSFRGGLVRFDFELFRSLGIVAVCEADVAPRRPTYAHLFSLPAILFNNTTRDVARRQGADV